MQEVFIPDLQSTYRWLSAAALVAIAAGVFTWQSYRPGQAPLRKVGQTLGPLLLLFGICSVVLLAWDLSRTPVIIVGDDYLIIGRDTVYAKEIRRAFLEPVTQQGFAGQGEASELGIVQFADGTQLILGADEYDTRAVVESIRPLLGVDVD